MSSGVSFLKYGGYDKSLTCMMILKEKGGSPNSAHVGGRKKKMLDCEAEVRVGRAGCQRQNKELQLFVLADQAWAEVWEWLWGGKSTGLLDSSSGVHIFSRL